MVRGDLRAWPGGLCLLSVFYLAGPPSLYGGARPDRVCVDSNTDRLRDYLKTGVSLGDRQGTLLTLGSQKSRKALKDGNFIPPITLQKSLLDMGQLPAKP